MDQEVKDILIESTELVKEVGPILEKQAALVKTAEQVTDILIEEGYIPLHKRAQYSAKLADPTLALEELIKLARKIGPDSLAEPTEDIKSASTPSDALVDWILG